MFKLIVKLDGETLTDEDDDVYETRSEAENALSETINNYETGMDILHHSNPGDYPWDEDADREYEWEIQEV